MRAKAANHGSIDGACRKDYGYYRCHDDMRKGLLTVWLTPTL